MELYGSNINKKFLYFIKRKLSLYFGKWKPEKIPYISGNGIFLYLRKFLIFQEVTFRVGKKKKKTLKKFLIFREMQLSVPKLKKLICQERTCKS